jgi:hypothetical protein
VRCRDSLRGANGDNHPCDQESSTNPTKFSYYPDATGPGGWIEIWYEDATNHGPAGRYRVIAQLPMATGGDTLTMEFDRQVP